MNILVVGNPSVGLDVAIYLGQHNIPFVDLKEWDGNGEKYLGKNVLVIKEDTKLSDLINVINRQNGIGIDETFAIKALPKIEEPKLITYADTSKPFYHGLYSKGVKKNKRFGR
jgi:hypothetical protein